MRNMDLQEKNKKSLKDFKKWLRRKKEMEEANIHFVKDDEIMEICSRQYVRVKSSPFVRNLNSNN